LLGALAPTRGNVAIHIGCGTGYYTAILAHLVGPPGKVIAYEIEPELGLRAVENLKPWDNVEVRIASGVDRLPRCDAIYVNAGATRPVASWLDALNEGGRLLFPLVGLKGAGVTLLTTKLQGLIAAKVIGFCGFVLAEMHLNQPKQPTSRRPSTLAYGRHDHSSAMMNPTTTRF